MPGVTVQEILTLLPSQAVGLGEAHEDPRARDKLIEWIKEDRVVDLVLELPSFASPSETAEIADTQRKNTTLLSSVVTAANEKNVNVHCWDDWHEKGVNPGSEHAVKNRNLKIAKEFLAAFNKRVVWEEGKGGARKCVLLFGAAHFRERDGLQVSLPGLKWADLSR